MLCVSGLLDVLFYKAYLCGWSLSYPTFQRRRITTTGIFLDAIASQVVGLLGRSVGQSSVFLKINQLLISD